MENITHSPSVTSTQGQNQANKKSEHNLHILNPKVLENKGRYHEVCNRWSFFINLIQIFQILMNCDQG